ncbi:MAG: hypothetical protein IT196_19805 [Acidimicrobiales bacterium]|nr:hypothetical protein [Acidimicrobiales bacterium]
MANANGRSAATARALRRESAPQQPRLRLVREAGRLRPGLVGTVVITLVFSTLFVLAFMQAVLVQGQLHLDQLDRQIAQKEQERARHQIEVATAEAPERIQAAAAANGLVSPPDVVFLERAAVTPVEVPPPAATPATPADAAAIEQAAAPAATVSAATAAGNGR